MPASRPSATRSPSTAVRYLVVAVLTGCLLRGIFFFEPPGRDQGIFLTVGREVAQGKALYREAWDHKPPLIYFVYALVASVPGRWTWAGPLLDAAFHSLAAIFLFLFLRRLLGGGPAVTGAFLYAIYAAGQAFGGWWGKLQAEVPLNAVTAVAAYAALLSAGRSRRPGRWLFALGALTATGIAFKLNAVFVLAPFAAYAVAWAGRSGGIRRVGRAAALLIAGGALVAAAVSVPLAAGGALGDAWDAVFTFNVRYLGGTGIASPPFHKILLFYVKLLGRLAEPVPLMLAALATAAVMLARAPRWRLDDALLPAWLAGALLMFLSGRWLFLYHAIPLTLPSAGLAGLGVWRTAQRLSGRRKLRVALVAGTAVLAAAAYLKGSVGMAVHNLRYMAGAMTPARYYAVYRNFDRCREVSARLAASGAVRQGDPILVWGFDALVYWLTGAAPATRFVTSNPLTRVDDDALRARYRRECMEDLKGHPPVAVVIPLGQHQFDDPRDDMQKLVMFERLYRYVQARYSRAFSTGDFDVYLPRTYPSNRSALPPDDRPVASAHGGTVDDQEASPADGVVGELDPVDLGEERGP